MRGNMSLTEKLSDPAAWEEYFRYKKEKRHLNRYEEADLKKYIEEKEYLPAAERICSGIFPIPEKKLIRKMYTEKKRVVYTWPREENYVFKLLTFLLIRTYDGIFSDNLYSFRADYGISRAMGRILNAHGIGRMYSYKVDISNYFNSVPAENAAKMLGDVLTDDPETARCLTDLLMDRRVIDEGKIISEEKGVMAGTPFAVFLANLYLSDMDRAFAEKGILYARYSDDIIVFAKTEEERDVCADRIRELLSEKGLSVNPSKEVKTAPGEMWTFLGISYQNGVTDISAVSKDKLKAKIRRKARSLKRWQARKGASGPQTVRAFLRAMNRKFFDCEVSSELTWTRWYFPLISTDRSLQEIDHYVQDWARYLASGRHSAKKFDFRYTDLKENGYESLVHAWYAYRENGFSEAEP